MQEGGDLMTLPGPDLTHPVLDLGRPELAPLMERYVSTAPAGIVRGPVALVVERPGFTDPRLKDALRARGWAVNECRGPSGTNCPLMSGNECRLRADSDVAIVFVDQRGTREPTSMVPRIRCASHPASPGVVAIEGSINGPAFGEHIATVGGLRGPDMIIETAERLVHSEKT